MDNDKKDFNLTQTTSKIQHSDKLISDVIDLLDSKDQEEKKEGENLLNTSLEQMCELSNRTQSIVISLLSLYTRYNLEPKKRLSLFTHEKLKFDLKNLTKTD